jgi:hypothetical protein
MLMLFHTLKPHYMGVVIIAQPVHKICTCYPDSDNCYLHTFVSILPKDAIKTITLSTRKILAAPLSKKKNKEKIQMPGAARAGIGLLIMGALLVGFGQYFERGALSLYGVIIVASGFVLYMTASIIAKRRAKI